MTPASGPIAPPTYLALIESRSNLDYAAACRDRSLRLNAEAVQVYQAAEALHEAASMAGARAERKAKEWRRAKWLVLAVVACDLVWTVWRVYG